MKKFILLLSFLSIFLIPSMSFATFVPSQPYYALIGNYYYSSNQPYTITSGGSLEYTGTLYEYRLDGSLSGTWTSGSISIGSNKNNIKLSNFDIYLHGTNTVFFSPPPVPITQISGVEELPPVILQHGGTVLSVALTGFGVLLVVSLIPRLVKRFLY